MGRFVDDEEEGRILEALREGKTTREVADEFHRSRSTISDVARRNGLDITAHARMKKNHIARTCYASEARIKAVGKLLDKALAMLNTCDNARDLQYIATSIAIGIDKRRLEDPQQPAGSDSGEIVAFFAAMKAKDQEEAGS